MICRLSGQVLSVGEEGVVIDLGGVSYEVMVPGSALARLQQSVGGQVTLFTLQYFEGNPAGAHLVPRLIGFLCEADRAFFNLLTRVRGISHRRALRIMSIPVPQIAEAIERGDLRLLTGLPEVGKKVGGQIVSELQGKLGRFLEPSGAPAPPAELTEAQRVALEILVQWGDRRAEAQRWVAAVVSADPTLTEPDAIVRAVYRLKQQSGG